MMKHAILITAYKDPDAILDLIEFFGEEFNIYIHLDKKSKINKDIFPKKQNIYLSSKFKVNWAGTNHLKCILHLIDEALKLKENEFFHLITGEDFPVKTTDEFANIDITYNYLRYFEMPYSGWGEDGGMHRISFFNFFDLFNAKSRTGKYLIDLLVKIQINLSINRKYSSDLPKLFGGSTYWSLNRDAVNYVATYTANHKKLLRRFKNTSCSEEFYFQTILMNSPLSSKIVNDNLRYIDWASGRGGYPSFLDETDYIKIINSPKLFARKIRAHSTLRALLMRQPITKQN